MSIKWEVAQPDDEPKRVRYDEIQTGEAFAVSTVLNRRTVRIKGDEAQAGRVWSMGLDGVMYAHNDSYMVYRVELTISGAEVVR